MRHLIAVCACLLSLLIPAHADEISPQINYVGLNDFIDDLDNADEIFSAYIETIKPIMARHGLTLQTYHVVHAVSDDITADAITFGTAPDQESFQAFFADPDFQMAFPELVGIIENHTVIFTSRPFSPKHENGERDTLLNLQWVDGNVEENIEKLREIDAGLTSKKRRFDVSDDAEARGALANRGLAAELLEIPAPHVLSVTSYRDAHGYFDNETVKTAHGKAREFLSQTSAFWIEKWK